MDAKAAFLSALNAASLGFIWSAAKIQESQGPVHSAGLLATSLFLLSAFLALRVILPRITLRQVFGRKPSYDENYHPVSYFGYVAVKFAENTWAEFASIVESMDERALANEALEQHFTISHIVAAKARKVALSGWLWMAAVASISVSIACRGS